MRDLLPTEILERGKWGFALPIGIWFRNELRESIRSLIDAEHCGSRDPGGEILRCKVAL